MHSLRPLVRAIPQKTVSTLANTQSNSLQLIGNHTHQIGNHPLSLLNHQTIEQTTAHNILNSFSTRPYTTNSFNKSESHHLLEQLQSSSFTTFELLHRNVPLNELSEIEFSKLKEVLRSSIIDIFYKSSTKREPHYVCKLIAFSNDNRSRKCLELIVEAFTRHGFVNDAESLVRYVGLRYRLNCSSRTYFCIVKAHSFSGDWDSVYTWFEAAMRGSFITPSDPWEEVLMNMLMGYRSIPNLTLDVASKLMIATNSSLSKRCINELIDLYATSGKPGHFLPLIRAIQFSRDPVLPLLRRALEVTMAKEEWEEALKCLDSIYTAHENAITRKMKFEFLFEFSSLATNFDHFYSILKVLENEDISEAYQIRFTELWMSWHRKIRPDLEKYSSKLQFSYFHTLLKVLIRQHSDPNIILELLGDMRRLGVRGDEDLKTLLDILQLNIGLSNTLSESEKNKLRNGISMQIPYVTNVGAGKSMQGNIQAQAANHRILNSQNPWVCAKELDAMKASDLRPSAVAITHTLARFLHSKHYIQGLSIFTRMQPTLKEIAKETGWVSACGPVYNFAIRLHCRNLELKPARDLIEELEQNGGFLDAYASAELVILLQKIAGYDDAINLGLRRLAALKQKRIRIPSYFFNVLLNSMVNGNRLELVWDLVSNHADGTFIHSAVTYGTLVKAALHENNYDMATELCRRAVDAKVYEDGPAMPIFCQIIEYNLEHRKNKAEIDQLLNTVQQLNLETNQRFDLLKLRSMTELQPYQLDDLVQTFVDMCKVSRLPILHFTTTLKNLINLKQFHLALELIRVMYAYGFTIDEEQHRALHNCLLQKKDYDAIKNLNELTSANFTSKSSN